MSPESRSFQRAIKFDLDGDLDRVERDEMILGYVLNVLMDPQGDHFQNVAGTCNWADPATHQIPKAICFLDEHLADWDQAVGDHMPALTMEIGKKSEHGWLRFQSQKVENAEFAVLGELWQQAKLSVQSGLTDRQFRELCCNCVRSSKLFELLAALRVERPGPEPGTIRYKDVFSHIKYVTDHSTSGVALDNNHGVTGERRLAEQRFIAFTHDLVYLFIAVHDFLHFHARGAAQLLYRFFRTHLHFSHEEAVRIVRVVDLHHVFELAKVDELDGGARGDRVLPLDALAQKFMAMDHGREIFGKLIRFALVDVGQNTQFKAEHVLTILSIIREITLLPDVDADYKQHLANRATQIATDIEKEVRQLLAQPEPPSFDPHKVERILRDALTKLQLITQVCPGIALPVVTQQVMLLLQ